VPDVEKLRHTVFWPSLVLLGGGLLYTLTGGDLAVTNLKSAARSMTLSLSGPLSITAMGALLVCMIVAVSPLGAVRLGGPEAEPELTKWQYFSIALCTTVAVGILFWATAEPLYQYQSPPSSLGIEPESQAARVFAMSTLLQHWTLIPYSLYAVPAVLFALMFYNLGQPFRLSSCLYPLLGKASRGGVGVLVDTVCLFALVAGMAASLGAGILTLGGGLNSLFGVTSGPALWVILGLFVVASFIVSAVSGLQKGVRILSDLNTKVFFILMLLIAILGPSGDRIALTFAGIQDYVINLVPRGLLLQFKPSDPWPLDWTLFYWTNWMAWAPVTALFLGRISKGYTVRQMMTFTLLLPSLFVTVWMGILGGSALVMESQSHTLLNQLADSGPESIIYSIMQTIPMGSFLSAVFVVGVFVSYVTAADSNTMAMAGLCWSGISPDSPDPPAKLKILWGCIVGSLAVIMICSAGIDGVKALSNLGGIPALFFEIACAVALLLMVVNRKRFE
jgi:glycine betaine transporter